MGTKTDDPDLSEFFKLSRPKKPPCQLGIILSRAAKPQLSETEAEQLRAALATDVGIITAAAIVAWLEARGHEVTFAKITNHRRGRCSCHD